MASPNVIWKVTTAKVAEENEVHEYSCLVKFKNGSVTDVDLKNGDNQDLTEEDNLRLDVFQKMIGQIEKPEQ